MNEEDLSEVEARIEELQADHAKAAMWRTETIAQLLTLARKQADALDSIEKLCIKWMTGKP